MNRTARPRLKLNKHTVRPMSQVRDLRAEELAHAAGASGGWLCVGTLICIIRSVGAACPTSQSFVWTTC
jgi:hypothetical protein